MMNEEGCITKVIGNKAWVLAQRNSMCESCDHKASCTPMGGDKRIEIEALNTANAKIGDRVVVSLNTSSFMKIAFLVYMLPLISLIIGVVTGLNFGRHYGYNEELSSLLTGLSFFAVTFLVIKRISKKMSNQRKYMPEITKIIKNIL